MPPELLFNIRDLDLTNVIADKAAIERVIPHRYEMMQLSAIVHLDPVQQLVIGYKDATLAEFWVRGHMPGFPLMPGVIMCEAAAQLMTYYICTQKLTKAPLVLFGGMDHVRFRGQVKVGDRLLMVCKATKIHPRQIASAVQGFVKDTMVFHGEFMGIPFTPAQEGERAQP